MPGTKFAQYDKLPDHRFSKSESKKTKLYVYKLYDITTAKYLQQEELDDNKYARCKCCKLEYNTIHKLQ